MSGLTTRLFVFLGGVIVMTLLSGCGVIIDLFLESQPELSLSYESSDALAYAEDFSFTATYSLVNTGGRAVSIDTVEHGIFSAGTDELDVVVTINTFVPVSLEVGGSATVTYAGYTRNANPPDEDYYYDMPRGFAVRVNYTDDTGESYEDFFPGNMFALVAP